MGSTSTSGSNPKLDQYTSEEYVGIRNKNEGSATLKPFSCYIGKVDQCNYATRLLTVKIDRATIDNCIYAAGAAASVLGISSYQLPPPGSQVVCFYTPLCTFVIGSAQQILKHEKIPFTSATGLTDYHPTDDFPIKTDRTKENQEDFTAPGVNTATDVMPNEQEIGNDLGIVLRFLTNLIQVDGGGLALIETCMANDMVRILSQYFVHHNCGGDTMIWSNGRCNYEQHFTSYPHEAAGKEEEHDPFAEPVHGSGIYTDKRDADKLAEIVDATGRWRESTYLGFLGDMLHFWITNPTKVVSNYAEGAARAGQFRTWVGADGTLVVQGAGDMVIEATSYMVIPQIQHKWDNPELDSAKIMSQLDNEYIKVWGSGERRWDDLNASVWQMRQYLKYLTIWKSLARFRQVSAASEGMFCSIPVESESKVGNRDCSEKDRKDENQSYDEVKPSKAVMRFSPDGSQMLISSGDYGISSVILNQGNIQLSAANNVEIKASGTVSITGRNVAIKALRTLELTSLCGQVVSKARTAWKALCEAGRMWLKSDMPEGGGKDPGENAMTPEFDDYSIVIDSSNGKTLVHGNKMVTVGTTDTNSSVNIEALNGQSEVNIYGYNINSVAQVGVYSTSKEWGVQATAASLINSPVHRIGETMSVIPSQVDIDGNMKVKRISTTSVTSLKGYIGRDEHNVTYDDEPDVEPEVEREATGEIQDSLGKLNKETVVDDFPKTEFSGTYRMWSMPYWYIASNNLQYSDSFKADPWTDDVLAMEERPENLIEFNWAQESRIMAGPRTNQLPPFPGQQAMLNVFTESDIRFSTVLDRDFSKDDIKSASDMKVKKLVYIFKNSSYE